MPLDSFKVSLNLGVFSVGGTWKPDDIERKAAWEMYVELVTRISVQKLPSEEGLLREALSSLYTLFNATRQILRKYGPSVAQPKLDGDLSFGQLAISILNHSLRPLLTKWHPLLRDHENARKQSVSLADHEKKWEYYKELREEIEKARGALNEYANLLADVAKIPRLHSQESSSEES